MTEHARSTGERRPAKPVGMVDFHSTHGVLRPNKERMHILGGTFESTIRGKEQKVCILHTSKKNMGET